jgi:hypothetical protein
LNDVTAIQKKGNASRIENGTAITYANDLCRQPLVT